MYDFSEIEEKWQKRWLESECFKAYNKSDKEKYYKSIIDTIVRVQEADNIIIILSES